MLGNSGVLAAVCQDLVNWRLLSGKREISDQPEVEVFPLKAGSSAAIKMIKGTKLKAIRSLVEPSTSPLQGLERDGTQINAWEILQMVSIKRV